MENHQLLLITENTSQMNREDQVAGYYLYDKEKELIAKIKGLIVESETYILRYILIYLGGFLMIKGKPILIPAENFEVLDIGTVRVDKPKEWLQGVPSPEDVEEILPAEEELILSYYDLEPYWAAKTKLENEED